MSIKNYFLSFSLGIAIAGASFAQTASERENIVKDYDHEKLESLSRQYDAIFNKQHREALEYARANNIPAVVTNDKGEKSYLHHMDDEGNLIYYKTLSIPGARSIGVNRVWEGGDLNLQLEGSGMHAGVWDGGKARETHELLSGKITFKGSNSPYDDHATHVTGILAGKKFSSGGQRANARGMANKATVDSYSWANDLSEMTSAAQGGLLVSNHSYGMDLSMVNNPMDYVGRYDAKSRQVDNIMYYAPYYTVVTAAGNDRGYGTPNPDDGGYNLLGGSMTTSKNTIVVGAVNKVMNYSGPGDVYMAPFSSWGPTNDFRIKPDIVANGMDVLSSYAFAPNGADSDNTYGIESGTSMASPSVAGAILLLQELSKNLNNGQYLTSAMVKALIIGTARQADNELGPNPKYGWGLMATDLAAELMLDAHNGGSSFYEEHELTNSNPTYTKEIQAESEELKVTMTWLDFPGAIQQTDTVFNVLSTDLDLRIKDSEGTTFYPWRLDSEAYDAVPLRDGDNNVDNVEQVLISDAVPGETYTIEVTHKGNLRGGKQKFAIVSKSALDLGVDNYTLSGFSIYPNPAANEVNLSLDKVGENTKVEIYDLRGRKVIDIDFAGRSNFNETLDISSLSTGVYLVKVNSDGKSVTKKLIVK